jgi:copper chaperone
MTESTYTVEGMSCDHCVKAVTEEVGKLDGVRSVAVDLTTGAVTVTSERPVAADDLRAAIDEAGYELVS